MTCRTLVPIVGVAIYGIDSTGLLWIFDRIDILDVYDDGLVIGAHEETFETIIGSALIT